MDINSYNIDFDIYRIGDCISYKGNTKNAFREKKIYIRGWCVKCKGPNNELEDLCKSCREVERHGYSAILADTGYKVCTNCYERFKYINYSKDIYCLWCQDLRILYNLDNKHIKEIIKEPDKIYEDSSDEDNNLIKCLNCTSYIPDYINDGLCCRCGSNDNYWD
jgi:hypothetical protein